MRLPNQLPKVGPTSMFEMQLRRLKEMAKKKGMSICKAGLSSWNLTMPDGYVHTIEDTEEMRRIVKDY